jgi:23S rRNA (adenine2503-C2)-methyltransferase
VASKPLHLTGATRDEVRDLVRDLGAEPYRGDQVLRWLYAQRVAAFDEMVNLPKPLRGALSEEATLLVTSVEDTSRGADGTEKLLLRLEDGEAVETVLIPEGDRRTVCVSTQVGCAMGCLFCASGLGGLERNLGAHEIVEQVLHARARLEPCPLTNLVIMGMGEPLANYEAVVRALRIFTASWGLSLSGRRITVSTVGLPAAIERLAGEGLGVNLAVSLHSADPATRARLVPAGGALDDVVRAAWAFAEQTGREVTFEYVLVRDENDSIEDARGLASIVARLPVLVNLIPLNPVPGLPWVASALSRVRRFEEELRRCGVQVVVRRRRGADVDAACGQLRRRSGEGHECE